MGKRKMAALEGDGEEDDAPATHRQFTAGHLKNQEKRLIVVLERANLESVKHGKGYELLNCDDHMGLMKKFKKNPSDYRPDILHQCLLMLQDSPLNQAGKLQVYIHTEKNVLIEVHPQCRIPRTFKRFAGLMVQLLHKMSVRANDGNIKLLKAIRNPITDHLPVGCSKIGTSFSATELINPRELVPTDEPIVIVIGAMAHGKVEVDYVEKEVSFSQYHLSAALTCAKVCSGFEEVWGIK
ncbi:ribosomal RNA small subunit methyltransferase NEP1-like [Macrobrachium nipponense]|uniref:ribosomal RNA small subunit methyltransferase NEP1-like n=1 Tax=Macrobrachium nipponense TaxID=159736 RepID=UPI0030C87573